MKMEDNFKVRIDRTFGTLISSSISSSSSQSISQPINSSLWSLTDEELEKNQWPREPEDPLSDNVSDDDDDEFRNSRHDAAVVDRFFLAAAGFQNPNSSDGVQNPNPNPNISAVDLGKKMVDDIDELDEDEDEDEDDAGEGEGSGSVREGGGEELPSSSRVSEGGDDDEFDVRNSIGLDSTLDFEEEEDTYDKLAVGREEAGERLFMRDATDYSCHVDSFFEIPTTFKEVSRDERANHLAAKLRLKEDAETAKNFNSLHVSEESSLASAAPIDNSDDGNNIKSILKRKEDQMDSKSEKRVRFDSTCKENDGGEYDALKNVTPDSSGEEITLHVRGASEQQQLSLVPGYVRNPSKYKHYTFDTASDMNEESNRQAYADFLGMLKKSRQSEVDEAPADLSKPVVFHPKKKPREVSVLTGNETDCTMEASEHRKNLSVSIVVGNEQENEACGMEVDEQVTTPIRGGNVKKSVRHYRSRQSLQDKESES